MEYIHICRVYWLSLRISPSVTSCVADHGGIRFRSNFAALRRNFVLAEKNTRWIRYFSRLRYFLTSLIGSSLQFLDAVSCSLRGSWEILLSWHPWIRDSRKSDENSLTLVSLLKRCKKSCMFTYTQPSDTCCSKKAWPKGNLFFGRIMDRSESRKWSQLNLI